MQNQTVIWSCWARPTQQLQGQWTSPHPCDFCEPPWQVSTEQKYHSNVIVTLFKNKDPWQDKTIPHVVVISNTVRSTGGQFFSTDTIHDISLFVFLPQKDETRSWPSMTSFTTTYRAPCIVLPQNEAVKVTTRTIMKICHRVDAQTPAICWIRKVMIYGHVVHKSCCWKWARDNGLK